MTPDRAILQVIYQVVSWNSSFENYKSRTIRSCGFVCVPNKEHGEGLTDLLALPDGLAVYGLFHLILAACSKHCAPRDGWLTSDGSRTAGLGRLRHWPSDSVCPAKWSSGRCTSWRARRSGVRFFQRLTKAANAGANASSASDLSPGQQHDRAQNVLDRAGI